MSYKGISAVIATILTLAIVTAIAGTAYMFTSSYFGSSIQGLEVNYASCIQGVASLYVRNIGDKPITHFDVEQTLPQGDTANSWDGSLTAGGVIIYTDPCIGTSPRTCSYTLKAPGMSARALVQCMDTYSGAGTTTIASSTTTTATASTTTIPGSTTTTTISASSTTTTIAASSTTTTILPSPTGLVGYWKFEGDAIDSSGNGNNGVVSGATFGSGRVNKAAQFDGQNDYVTVLDSPSLDLTNKLTFIAWIYVKNFPATPPRIISKEKTTSSMPYAFELGTAGAVEVCLNVSTTESCLSTPSGIIVPNVWYHVAATWDGSTRKIYVNGVEKATGSFSGTMANTANNVVIGNNPTSVRAFNGTIDEVKIYNTALAQADIAADFNDGLVEYLKFDEESGTSTGDSSGNGNDGTINGPTFVVGKIGSALQFDGVDDYVIVPYSSTLDISNAFTFEAWIYPTSFGESSLGRIFDKNYTTGYGFYIRNNSASQIEQFAVSLNNSAYGSTNYSIVLNTWQHIAVTFNNSLSSGQVKFYLNGAQVRTAWRTTVVDTNTEPLYIGNIWSLTRTFKGIIDEVMIYNRNLNSTEISQDYQKS